MVAVATAQARKVTAASLKRAGGNCTGATAAVAALPRPNNKHSDDARCGPGWLNGGVAAEESERGQQPTCRQTGRKSDKNGGATGGEATAKRQRWGKLDMGYIRNSPINLCTYPLTTYLHYYSSPLLYSLYYELSASLTANNRRILRLKLALKTVSGVL